MILYRNYAICPCNSILDIFCGGKKSCVQSEDILNVQLMMSNARDRTRNASPLSDVGLDYLFKGEYDRNHPEKWNCLDAGAECN
jgi:hypothetical protein